jgi:ABC-2 type transport system permease protein
MLASTRAELLKLRRRPAVWILGGFLLVTLALFGYLFGWLFIVREVGGDAVVVDTGEDYLRNLLPEQVVAGTLAGFAELGGAFALILGALAVGSEYGWRTLKTITTQGPSRLQVAAGKAGGLAVLVAVLALACLLVALLSSLAIAAAEEEAITLPGPVTLLGGVGAAWLVLMVWTSLGMLLASLFRGTGLAIGLGLVYVLLVEQLLLAVPFPDRLSDVFAAVLVVPNTFALALGFGDIATPGIQVEPVGAWQAVLVLTGYMVAALAVSAFLFRRREIA